MPPNDLMDIKLSEFQHLFRLGTPKEGYMIDRLYKSLGKGGLMTKKDVVLVEEIGGTWSLSPEGR